MEQLSLNTPTYFLQINLYLHLLWKNANLSQVVNLLYKPRRMDKEIFILEKQKRRI